MNDLLNWLGWGVDNAFCTSAAITFWSAPLGLFCSGSLCITSIFRTFHGKSKDGLFDTLWHMAFTFVCGAAFFVGVSHDEPHHLVKSMVILMAIRGIYKAVQVHRQR